MGEWGLLSKEFWGVKEGRVGWVCISSAFVGSSRFIGCE